MKYDLRVIAPICIFSEFGSSYMVNLAYLKRFRMNESSHVAASAIMITSAPDGILRAIWTVSESAK